MRSKMERDGLEQLKAEYDNAPSDVVEAREFVRDVDKGLGGGWNKKGSAFLTNFDRIFGGHSVEGSI